MSDDSSSFESVNTTSSSLAITGLYSQNVYNFTVQVSTGNGIYKGGGGGQFGEHVYEGNIGQSFILMWKVWWPKVSTFEYLYIDHCTCKTLNFTG